MGGVERLVADLSAAVTDTNALMFYAAGSPRLGKRAAVHFAACERQQALLYVPVVVVWECVLLVRRGRLSFAKDVPAFFDDLFSNPAFQPYDLTVPQVLLAAEMAFTQDPFDALICAAAADLELPLMTGDTEITASKRIRVLW